MGVGCWVLGVGCWALRVGCWVLGVGCWALGVGVVPLDARKAWCISSALTYPRSAALTLTVTAEIRCPCCTLARIVRSIAHTVPATTSDNGVTAQAGRGPTLAPHPQPAAHRQPLRVGRHGGDPANARRVVLEHTSVGRAVLGGCTPLRMGSAQPGPRHEHPDMVGYGSAGSCGPWETSSERVTATQQRGTERAARRANRQWRAFVTD